MAKANTPVETVETVEKNADELAVSTPVKKSRNTQRVRVYIPKREDEEGSNVKIDPYEHVTINGRTTLIRRGEYVDVTIPVYIQLKNKYPNI